MLTESDIERIVQRSLENSLERSVERAVEKAAEQAAERALRRAFINLGLSLEDPEHVAAWHADRLWTRQAREGSNSLKIGLQTSVIGSIITAILLGIWFLVNSYYGK